MMRRVRWTMVSRRSAGGILICSALLMAGCQSAGRPGAVPATFKLDPFYTQYLDADGIPVTASRVTPPKALIRARRIIGQMLEHRPDVRAALVKMGARVAIMAESEQTMDLPEQRDWKKPAPDDPALTVCERKHYDEWIGRLTDREYWNGRARGMGGLLTSGAAENILGKPDTRYYGENIFVHEFSHEILVGVREADPALYARLEAAYRSAMSRGLWKGEYAATTVDEYWAEGTQFWFNSNKLAVVDGHTILSDEDLRAYDPELHAILATMYGTRHHLTDDAFYRSPARVPPGGPPASTAAEC